jgi:transcriptional repressor NrdR
MSGDSDVIRRRRECLDCGRRFTTYERVEDILPMVIKKDGRREPFDRNKILSGIQTACQKRPVSVEVLEEIVGRIEKTVQDKGDKEIKSSTIGETVMQELHELDEVAYVRFASVYRNEFMDELKDLLDEEETRRRNGEKKKK